jgi:hypothetical protein
MAKRFKAKRVRSAQNAVDSAVWTKRAQPVTIRAEFTLARSILRRFRPLFAAAQSTALQKLANHMTNQ